MGSSSLYKNLIYLLISLIFINIAVGFYKSVSKNYKSKSSKINYSILNKDKDIKSNSEQQTVDFIGEAKEMMDIFEKYNFSVDSFLAEDSSNLIVFSSLPKDFMTIEPVTERKKLFINTLIPIIFIENKKILDDRKRILDWWRKSDGDSYSRDFWPSWLFELSEKYDSEEPNLGNLLIKVDAIPISLALAQAAIESGWGTSRYLRDGNAIYGQYTFDKENGIVPKRRDEDKEFLIRKFSSLSDATRSYMKNLNTHRAYEKFRQERRKLRMNGETLSGKKLSNFLTSYSERKMAYVKDLKKLIESNNFMKFDSIYFFAN